MILLGIEPRLSCSSSVYDQGTVNFVTTISMKLERHELRSVSFTLASMVTGFL